MYKEIERDRVQGHIWLTASTCLVKNLRISSYIGKPFLKYDFAPDPIWISLYKWGKFSVLSVFESFLYLSISHPSLSQSILLLVFNLSLIFFQRFLSYYPSFFYHVFQFSCLSISVSLLYLLFSACFYLQYICFIVPACLLVSLLAAYLLVYL